MVKDVSCKLLNVTIIKIEIFARICTCDNINNMTMVWCFEPYCVVLNQPQSSQVPSFGDVGITAGGYAATGGARAVARAFVGAAYGAFARAMHGGIFGATLAAITAASGASGATVGAVGGTDGCSALAAVGEKAAAGRKSPECDGQKKKPTQKKTDK